MSAELLDALAADANEPADAALVERVRCANFAHNRRFFSLTCSRLALLLRVCLCFRVNINVIFIIILDVMLLLLLPLLALALRCACEFMAVSATFGELASGTLDAAALLDTRIALAQTSIAHEQRFWREQVRVRLHSCATPVQRRVASHCVALTLALAFAFARLFLRRLHTGEWCVDEECATSWPQLYVGAARRSRLAAGECRRRRLACT